MAHILVAGAGAGAGARAREGAGAEAGAEARAEGAAFCIAKIQRLISFLLIGTVSQCLVDLFNPIVIINKSRMIKQQIHHCLIHGQERPRDLFSIDPNMYS